jgi:hypothetical protein
MQTMAMTKLKLTSLCFLILFFSTPSFGFCFEPHRTVTCDFLNSDAVFIGKVLSMHSVKQGDAFEYRIRVIRQFRGTVKEVIAVYTGNDSGEYQLDLKEEYLIFASEYKNQLWVSNCDDSVPISKASDLLREIKKIEIPRDGIVEGRIALNYVPSNNGLPGVKVLIRGEGKTYGSTTDPQGWFRLHVLPGSYSLETASTPAHPIIPYDLNYGGDSKRFVVKAGRCAGFEFVANSINKY